MRRVPSVGTGPAPKRHKYRVVVTQMREERATIVVTSTCPEGALARAKAKAKAEAGEVDWEDGYWAGDIEAVKAEKVE